MMKRLMFLLFVFVSLIGYSQGAMLLVPSPASGGNLLLDDYPGSTVAFDVRKIDNDYVGSCLRIREDGGDTETDIGFSGNDIDEAAITSHCSGNNCFVVKWYNQGSGGATYDMSQSTKASQPKIYDVSTGIIYQNSKVALEVSSSSITLSMGTTVASNIDFTTFSVAKRTAQWSAGVTFYGTSSSYIMNLNGSNRYQSQVSQGYLLIGSQTYTTQKLQTNINQQTSSDIEMYADGSLVHSGAPISSGGTTFDKIGTNGTGGGHIQSMIYYPSDQSANRSSIESNINTYFSIY